MALDKITTDIIADDAVTAAKIVSGAVVADIADNSITAAKISTSYSPTILSQNATQNLSGTYSSHQTMLSEAYVLSGDVTLTATKHLTLSKLSDNGVDITLKNDGSTRTLSGAGVLEGGLVRQTHDASVTGKTGELGSAVTGSPSLNLGNATFPVGHVVNTTFKGCTASLQLNQASEIFVSAANGIENLAVTAGNKLAIWFIGGNIYSSTNSPYYCGMQIRVNDNSSDTDYQSTISAHVGSDARFDPITAFAFHNCAGTSIDIMYGLWGYSVAASTHYYLTAQHYTAGQADGLRFCVQEIQA